MKSDRALKLDKLRAKASPPNSDADRLVAISRCANMTDLGRPSRDYMRDQLREIESRNIDPAVIVQISEIRDRFAHNKGVKARRLERRARAEMGPINGASTEPAPAQTESAPTDQSPAPADPNDPTFPYPLVDILFPPPAGLYELGSIDMAGLADRLRCAGLKGHPPRLTSDELNETIVRAAIDQPLASITLDLLQRLYFGLEFERKAEDQSMLGDRFRFWPYVYLLGAVTYIAQRRFGFDSLRKAPPSPAYLRALLRKPKSELSLFERLETIPNLEARAKLYSDLPGFPELIREFQSYKENSNA